MASCNEHPIQHQYSRFLSDFNQLLLIGCGASGSVFKVENKFDKWIYAVKCVKLCDKIDQNNRILREVTTLSRLHHSNVVRYYNAWVESPPSSSFMQAQENVGSELRGDSVLFCGSSPSNRDQDVASFERVEEDDNDNNNNNTPTSISSQNPFSEHSDLIVFKDSPAPFRFGGGGGGSNHNVNVNYFLEEGEGCDLGKGEHDDQQQQQQQHCVVPPPSLLFIQMEFCEKNLKELIAEGLPDDQTCRVFFSQLVEGLDYLHSQGIMHRDLKPSNIFVGDHHGIRVLKIGDFGLATNVDSTKRSTQAKTRGVGTYFYASPEIQGYYDQKTDIWSLGVVFFEMCRKFSSDAERADILQMLREVHLDVGVQFPANFENDRPTEAAIIRKMLNWDPSERPTTKQLLQEEYLSQVEGAKPREKELESRLFDRETTISKLEEMLATRDEKIEEQRSIIQKLQEAKNSLECEVKGLAQKNRLLEIQVEKWKSRSTSEFSPREISSNNSIVQNGIPNSK